MKTAKKIYLVLANAKGELFEHPTLEAVGARDREWSRMDSNHLIPLPEGSMLFHLPATKPVGYNRKKNSFEILSQYQGEEVFAATVLLVQGYTRTFLPAWQERSEKKKEELPLWAWTAIGWDGEAFVVPAFRSDPDTRMDPANYEEKNLAERVEKRLLLDPDNPILRQLKKCALEYFCLAAQNAFLERWECPVPVSSTCNSRCLGCISELEEGRVASPQNRLNYIPKHEHIYRIASYHFQKFSEGMISFGQGCEGDPILRTNVIVPALKRLREEYPNAALNMNTNASKPKEIVKLVEAGLNSIRVSMNSARKEFYNAYYNPKGYQFESVVESIQYCASHHVYTSLNYLVFPGINDRWEEIEPLIKLIRVTGLHMVQLRNLNIDPDTYLSVLPERKGEIIGLENLREVLKKEFPHLDIGYYNRAKKNFFGYSSEKNRLGGEILSFDG